MNKFKKVTHLFAAALAGAAAFAVSPAGQGLVKQYPWASGIAAGILGLAALYHSPKASS
ncbi:MAG: hypothetical protein ACRD8A_12615 [Candidatus Acidiferrales bacterium]